MRWIIGDIHGYFDKLTSVLDQILATDSEPTFIFLGDYIDRGPDSKKVITRLINLDKEYKCHFLMGNHDSMLCQMLDTSHGEMMNYDPLDCLMRNGFANTASSYGCGPNEVVDVIKADADHFAFFDSLKFLYVDEDICAVHGIFDETAASEALYHPKKVYALDYLLWSRPTESYINSMRYGDRILYHGHSPTQLYNSDKVIFGPYVRMVDTGSFLPGGTLSAICHETSITVTSN